jgi:SAM-dependent methyltransferase
MSRVPYDDFAEIYDAWVDGIPLTEEMRSFYVELLAESAGPVVELGVGNGRICVEVATRGQRVVGVDSSTEILELCRERSREAGVDDRLELIHADFRDFQLAEPAALITIPFHSIGHLLTEKDKRLCMTNVHSQLVPGGRFVWDHFVFDPSYPASPGLRLRADWRVPETGRRKLVWESSSHDLDRQVVEVLARIEYLDQAGVVEKTRYSRMDLSWIDPERSRELLEECGFEIEALYGDFGRGPFEEGSTHQVWVARQR